MSNALSGETLKMWFENKPYVAPAAWISYRDKDYRRIGPRDKLDQSKVTIDNGWIILSPSELDRNGIDGIAIYDAAEEGNGLLWWDFDLDTIDLKAGESATVWNPIG